MKLSAPVLFSTALLFTIVALAIRAPVHAPLAVVEAAGSRNQITWAIRECRTAEEVQLFLGELSAAQAASAKVVFSNTTDDWRPTWRVFFLRAVPAEARF